MRGSVWWEAGSARLKQHAPETWWRLVRVQDRVMRSIDPLLPLVDLPRALREGLLHRQSLAETRSFVIFVGYPRSGHTVVASLLNAHPEAVIGHRFRVLRNVAVGFGRQALLGMVFVADQRFEREGRLGNKQFNYAVPNQWQGRFRRLLVVGDGNVVNTTIQRRPELLVRLRERLAMPVKVIHVVRNPFDNIATMAIRNRVSLDEAADRYFEFCRGVVAIRSGTDSQDWIDLRHEDLLADPVRALGQLCDFLGLGAEEDYLVDCSKVVYQSPHRSRHEVSWPPGALARVEGWIDRTPHLQGYSFKEPVQS